MAQLIERILEISNRNPTDDIIKTLDLKTPYDVAMIPERYPLLFKVLKLRYNSLDGDEYYIGGLSMIAKILQLLMYSTATSPHISNNWLPDLLRWGYFGVADRVFLAKKNIQHILDNGQLMTPKMMCDAVRGHENDELRESYMQAFISGA